MDGTRLQTACGKVLSKLFSTAPLMAPLVAPFVAMLMATLVVCSGARADVGIVLNESLDTSVARITGSGHSAVYLSRICPASPTKMRLCAPGEQGSVISNYTTLGEDDPFELNIVSLNTFVYGVSNMDDRPLFSSFKIKGALEEHYRENVIRDYCASKSCQTSNKAEWREMVSAASERTLYILIASTTLEQDKALIDKFNAMPNVNHFNGMTRNCADFTKNVIDTYFPHAAHRDPVNDFGMTSPKAIARTFAHYAHEHPEMQYRVVHFAQLPGTIKHSTECRSGTEQLYHSKKLVVPMAFFAWHELPVVAGSYLLTGRFNPEHEFEQHATIGETLDARAVKVAESDDDDARVAQLKTAEEKQRDSVVGSPEEWAAYREAFDSMVTESVNEGLIPNRGALEHVFKNFDETGKPFLDSRGDLWLSVQEQENGKPKTVNVGLTPNNVLARGSDPLLAYRMILAHVNEALKSTPRRRESIAEFKETWALLQQARAELHPQHEPALAMQRAALAP